MAFFAATLTAALAETSAIRVWPGAAPGSEHWKQTESTVVWKGEKRVRNVVEPSLTLFLPKASSATSTAVIVAPGRGFRLLSWESEGTRVGEWLAEHGVAAFVLKYRLMDTGPTEEDFLKALETPARPPSSEGSAAGGSSARSAWTEVHEFSGADAAQAVKVVRKRAAEWGVAPGRVGLLGFSAGAFATMNAVLGDPAGRPDFAAPIYGGTTGGAAVPADAPPLFILVANNDRFSQTSVELYSAWKAADRPVELHIYSTGGHGFGMNKKGIPIDSWIERFADWMGQQGLLKR